MAAFLAASYHYRRVCCGVAWKTCLTSEAPGIRGARNE
jgi:hypothetical protein